MPNKNVIVAFGGRSPEHEVSVLSAMQAITALQETNYSVVPLYVTKAGRWLTGDYLLELEHYQDLEAIQQHGTPCTFSHDDVGHPVLLETQKSGLFSKPKQHAIYAVIPAFHGSEGENGAFQGTCEMFHIPFGGSGVMASSIGMDKVQAKALCRAHGLTVTDDRSFYEHQWQDNQSAILGDITPLGYPLIVKPATLGSSIGVQKVSNDDALANAIETAFRYDAHLLVEKAVQPLTEINCAVLGIGTQAQASVCERPKGKQETLSFEDKYQSEGAADKGMASADRVIPADISDELRDRIQALALHIFGLFEAAGVARLDFLVNADTKTVYFNEINTIPGSFSFYLWQENGLPMPALMKKLVDVAITKHQAKTGRIRSYNTNLLSEKALKGIKGLKSS